MAQTIMPDVLTDAQVNSYASGMPDTLTDDQLNNYPVIPEVQKAGAIDTISHFSSFNPFGQDTSEQGKAIADVSKIGKSLTDKLHSLPYGSPERKVILKQLQAIDDAAANAASYQLQQIPSTSEAIEQQGTNAIKSTGNILGGAAKGIANLFSPSLENNTLVNLGKVGAGAIEKLIPGTQGQEKYIDALGKNYKDKYYDTSVGDPNATGLGKVGRFVQRLGAGTERAAFEDPARVLSDVSLASGLVGGAAKLASKGASALGYEELAGSLSSTGGKLTQLGKDINPVVQTVRAGVAVTKLAYNAGKFLATRLASGFTGRGSAAAERIVDNPSGVNEGLSGTVSAKKLAEDAQKMRDDYDAAASKDYQDARTSMALDTTDAPKSALNAVGQTVKDIMSRYKIKWTKAGGYDFSSSPLRADPSALKVAETALEEADKLEGGATWGDIDTLKQTMSGLYKGGERSNAVTETLRHSARVALSKVPNYDATMGAYEDAADAMKTFQEAAGIGDKTNMATAANKLLGILKDNNQVRSQMIQDLVVQSGAKGQQLLNNIAGNAYKDIIGSSALGKIGLGGGALALMNGLGNPTVWAAVLSTSPQVLGRLLQLYGFTGEAAQTVAEIISQTGTALPIAGAGTLGNQVNQAVTDANAPSTPTDDYLNSLGY